MIKKRKKQPIVLIGIMLVIILAIYFKDLFIKYNGIYLLAYKAGISKGGKSGSSSIYTYHYNNASYQLFIKDYGRGDSLIFLKILPKYPSQNLIIKSAVPKCLTKADTNKIWEELPICN